MGNDKILFSDKVTFVIEGKSYIGRVCQIMKDGTCKVVTTGENGKLWHLEINKISKVRS